MVLVLDATTLGERWTILSISVVIRSCAIPVAWKKVLGGHEKGSWQPHWKGLLKHLDGCIPAEWQVVVMTDRGLYARWLFQAILDCGWHPFLRINLGVKARAVGEETFNWIGRWTPTPGTHWKGEVECFVGKQSRLTCTLLMHWEAGYEAPWAVLTDLAPEEAEVSWYGMRTWIETGFKDFKRGLWGWHHSKMQDASRVERLWLAMAVAQVWTVSIGCQAEEKERTGALGESLPAQHIASRRRKRPVGQPPTRRLSCVVRGHLGLVAALFTAEVLPCGIWPKPGLRRSSRPESFGNLRSFVSVSANVSRNVARVCAHARLHDPLKKPGIPPSEPVRAVCRGIRLSTSPGYLLASSRDSISTSHFPFRVLTGSASSLPPRQNWFHECCHRFSLLSVLPKQSAQAITAIRWV